MLKIYHPNFLGNRVMEVKKEEKIKQKKGTLFKNNLHFFLPSPFCFLNVQFSYFEH